MDFLDPRVTKNGDPFGPFRYQQIIQECYIISKNCNTSYDAVLKMTPTERNSILHFISDEAQKMKEEQERLRVERKNKR